MSDLISRQDAIDCFNGKIRLPYDMDTDLLKLYIQAVVDAINKLPSYSEIPNKWIPVSERLPDEAFGCFVTVEEDDRNGEPQRVLYPDFVGYDGETWNDASGTPIAFEVIAWMPLPKPYKDGGE